jgi:5-methylcytosine-specific restriction endonuclease McrA
MRAQRDRDAHQQLGGGVMAKVSRAEFNRIKKRSADRAKRKDQNARFIAKIKRLNGAPAPLEHDRTAIKEQIVRLLGLLDRRINGNNCRIHGEPCVGEVAYHIVPQKRGDAARFIPENVVWACSRANYGENMNRDLYRHKHVLLFGKVRVELLETISRTKKKFSTAELVELRDQIKADVESARRGS